MAGQAVFDESLDQVEAPIPVRLFTELVAQRDCFAAIEVVQRDHAVGQFVHGQAEEAVCAGRCEIHLDAAGRAEGIDDDRTAVEPGCEAAEEIVAAGQAPEPDGEGVAETDDQRHDQRGQFDLAEMSRQVFMVADDVDDGIAQRGFRRAVHHHEPALDRRERPSRCLDPRHHRGGIIGDVTAASKTQAWRAVRCRS